LRDGSATARELLRRGRELQERVAGRAWLIVNDRIDVALALGADGAQLGVRSLPVADARRAAPQMRLGASVHSVAEAVAAVGDGASWVVLGTIYPTRSHP